MSKKEIYSAILAGIFWSILMILFKYLMDEINSTYIIIHLITGQGFGFLFTWSMKRFAKKVEKSITLEIPEDEQLLKEGGANHFKGMEGVGGKLFLTNQKLYFKSHKFNVQNHTLEILLEQIDNVERVKTAKVINNGIKITLQDGTWHQFVVNDVQEWYELISKSRFTSNIS